MVISLFGQTDKRAVLYTMLQLCEYLGDCAYVTNDRKAMRLMEEGPADSGSYRNVDIFITDAMGDDMWAAIDHAPQDYDYLFLDNIYVEESGCRIYVKGEGVDDADQLVIDAFEPGEIITIKMGRADPAPKVEHVRGRSDKDEVKPKVYNIPYSGDIPANIERCEFYRELRPITGQAAKVCATILSELTDTPLKNLMQVSTRQGQKGAKK